MTSSSLAHPVAHAERTPVEPVARVAKGLAAPPALYSRPRPAAVSVLLRVSVPLLIIALWAVGSHMGWIAPNVLAPPLVVLKTAWQLATSGVLWHHLSISLTRAAMGLLIGGGLGLVLGALAGLHKVGEELIDPTAQMVRAIPFLALVPLFIVWFGIGEVSKVLLIAAAAAKPMYLNAYGGVRSADHKLLEAGLIFGMTPWQRARDIYWPAALPLLMVGLRLALTLSLIALIAVEVINTSQGIGFLMLQAQEFFQTEILLVCMVIYALFGLSSDLLVRLLEWLLMPWRRRGAYR